jgi:hypothetical protein
MKLNEFTVSVPVVDTMNCLTWSERAQLVLAAYMIARIHDLPYIYVNGTEHYLQPLPEAPEQSENTEAKSNKQKKPKEVLVPDPLSWLLFVPVDAKYC